MQSNEIHSEKNSEIHSEKGENLQSSIFDRVN